jgi:serine/threonine protein kinase
MRMVETWVISEYCNAGNLQDAVMLHNGGLFFQDSVPQMGVMLRTLLGVSNAMEWLHTRNVLHGDLKCANVMLHVNNMGGASNEAELTDDLELVPKVVDFGLSRVITQGATHLSTHTFGTITHQPPELMRSGRLSKPADVYSFGVLMWEMIMAAHPWTGKMMGEIMTAVMIEGKRLSFGSTIPQAFAQLAEGCWEEDPASRPTFAQITAQLEQLLSKEDELQEEVSAAYSSVLNSTVQTWDDDDG